MSFNSLVKAVSVEGPLRYADWQLLKFGELLTCSMMPRRINRSRIFEMLFRFEMGLKFPGTSLSRPGFLKSLIGLIGTLCPHPIAVSKSIAIFVSTLKEVKRMRSGVLLVEVQNKKELDNLCKIEKILDIPVRVSPHKTLNQCKGIIISSDLDEVSKIKESLL